MDQDLFSPTMYCFVLKADTHTRAHALTHTHTLISNSKTLLKTVSLADPAWHVGVSGDAMGSVLSIGSLLRPVAWRWNRDGDITSWLARWFPKTPAKSVVALKTPIKVELVAGKTYKWYVCVATAKSSPFVMARTSSNTLASPHWSSRPRRPAWWRAVPSRQPRNPHTAMVPTRMNRCRRQNWALHSEGWFTPGIPAPHSWFVKGLLRVTQGLQPGAAGNKLWLWCLLVKMALNRRASPRLKNKNKQAVILFKS